MQLSNYLKKLDQQERESFAKRAGTTVAYLYQIAGGHRRSGKDLALRIETASHGEVTRHETRPDLSAWAA